MARKLAEMLVKRFLDIVFSLCALIVLAPIFLIVSILIKLEDGGPVFYRAVRVGKGGKLFKMFKLRTMIQGADRFSGPSTPTDDPYITKIGKFIRRFNLDELLQFINVLKGDMSIVGPRPEVPQYVALFTEEEKAILTMRPGITDWATLWIGDKGKILSGGKDHEKYYLEKIRPQKIKLQLEYVKNHSLATDSKIMLKTLKVHFFDRLR